MTRPVAIIPARGGSRRIAGKNIRDFSGRPIISYSIETARQSELFDSIIVSTDSEEIADVARRYGAQVPFIRPASLADDFATTSAAFAHALEELDIKSGLGCCIYATAPFLKSDDLRRGFETMTAAHASGAFAVTTFPAPIFRALTINSDGRLEMLWPGHRDARSNDLPDTFHDAGMFYWVDVARFRAKPELYNDAMPVVIPRHRVHDIDTLEDWKRAELVFRALAHHPV